MKRKKYIKEIIIIQEKRNKTRKKTETKTKKKRNKNT